MATIQQLVKRYFNRKRRRFQRSIDVVFAPGHFNAGYFGGAKLVSDGTGAPAQVVTLGPAHQGKRIDVEFTAKRDPGDTISIGDTTLINEGDTATLQLNGTTWEAL